MDCSTLLFSNDSSHTFLLTGALASDHERPAWDKGGVAPVPPKILQHHRSGSLKILPAALNGMSIKSLSNCLQAYGHSERVFDVRFSPVDSSLIASASEDTTVRLWKHESDSGSFKQVPMPKPASNCSA